MKKTPLIAAAGAAALAAATALFTADGWMPASKPVPEAVSVKPAASAPPAKIEPESAPTAGTFAKSDDQQVTKPVAVAVPEDKAPAAVPAQDIKVLAATPEAKAAPAPDPVDMLAPTISKPDGKPRFDTVRVEKSGDAVIAGTAKPGADVEVKLNGETVGTASANADGAFVVIPEKPLPAGTGALTIVATSEGAVVASEETVAIAVPLQKPAAPAAEDKPAEPLVALVKPAEPIKIIQTPAPAAKGALSLDSIDYSDAGDILFKGKAESGATLRLYANNALLGDVAADADGTWTFDGRDKLAPGTYSLRVDQLGRDGVVKKRLELPFTREAPDVVVAALSKPPTKTEVEIKGPSLEDGLKDAALAALPKDGRIVIQPGNNLWKLSRVIYGKGTAYTVIFEANKANIRDPDMIFPGQIFTVPDANPPETIDPAQSEPLGVDASAAAPK